MLKKERQTKALVDPIAPAQAAALRGEPKRAYVRRLFDQLAPRYDGLNWVISVGQVPYWRWRAFRGLPVESGMRLLDVGCGTGASVVALRRRYPRAEICGMDLAPEMIALARRRDPEGSYFVGDVQEIPIGPWDGITTVFTTRNFPDLHDSLKSLAGAVRSGGFLLILDTFRPQGPRLWRAFQAFWLRRVIPTLVRPFTNPDAFRYLGESILRHVTDQACAGILTDLGCTIERMDRYALGTASAILARRGPNRL